MVTNRRGATSLLVVWRRGDGFEFITPMVGHAGDVDVTGPVLRALRDARSAIKKGAQV